MGKAVGDCVKAESGKDFMLDGTYGYVHSCPTNLELACALPFTATSPDGPRRVLTSSRPGVKSSPSSPEAPAENLVARPVALMTSPTSTAWATLRSSWSRS